MSSERWRDLVPVGVMLLVGLLDGVGGLAGFAVAIGAYVVAVPVSVAVWWRRVGRHARATPADTARTTAR